MLWRKLHLNWMYGLGEFAIVVLGVLEDYKYLKTRIRNIAVAIAAESSDLDL